MISHRYRDNTNRKYKSRVDKLDTTQRNSQYSGTTSQAIKILSGSSAYPSWPRIAVNLDKDKAPRPSPSTERNTFIKKIENESRESGENLDNTFIASQAKLRSKSDETLDRAAGDNASAYPSWPNTTINSNEIAAPSLPPSTKDDAFIKKLERENSESGNSLDNASVDNS